jgi:hypothetical protein
MADGIMAKGLRLLRFEFDIAGAPIKCVALAEDTVEDKDRARKYIFDKVIEQKGNREDIALNGISDYGLLTFFSPGVVELLEDYFVGKIVGSKRILHKEEGEPKQKKRPSLEKKK